MAAIRPASKVAMSKLWMCEGEEAPAEEAASSVLDDLSSGNAELLEQIKGLTLVEAAALIKEVDSTFGLTKEDEEEVQEEEAAAA